jgi:hypothetical protein
LQREPIISRQSLSADLGFRVTCPIGGTQRHLFSGHKARDNDQVFCSRCVYDLSLRSGYATTQRKAPWFVALPLPRNCWGDQDSHQDSHSVFPPEARGTPVKAGGR